jgi:hypothetical protein
MISANYAGDLIITSDNIKLTMPRSFELDPKIFDCE